MSSKSYRTTSWAVSLADLSNAFAMHAPYPDRCQAPAQSGYYSALDAPGEQFFLVLPVVGVYCAAGLELPTRFFLSW